MQTTLADQARTFGQFMRETHGERVHKIAIDANFTCPNRDGTKGTGGCTFCNNGSFSPNGRKPKPISTQIAAGREVILKRTGARKYLAYFQAYTNTYQRISRLKSLYDEALAEPDVVGLSIGTRPDCVSKKVIDLLVNYQHEGYDVWLELGLQSAFDDTLERVNRGHSFEDYRKTTLAARQRGLRVCTHLIAGLPGENQHHCRESLRKVLEVGTDGLKLHPLHVVKGTQLANSWRQGEYQPLSRDAYVQIAAEMVLMAPDIIWHRLTGTASKAILLAPQWCSEKWPVLNGIEHELRRRRSPVRRIA